MTDVIEPQQLARGLCWQQMPEGMVFRTSTRTVTEPDLITFITWAGIITPLFMDARFAQEVEGYAGRLVPGMVTYCFSEGLLAQTGFMQGTGIAIVSTGSLEHRAPVFVGDTLHSVVTVTESRPSSKPGRGVVASTVSVRNQHGAEVLSYTPVRLMRSAEDRVRQP
jgi:acyl dehydratase